MYGILHIFVWDVLELQMDHMEGLDVFQSSLQKRTVLEDEGGFLLSGSLILIEEDLNSAPSNLCDALLSLD